MYLDMSFETYMLVTLQGKHTVSANLRKTSTTNVKNLRTTFKSHNISTSWLAKFAS